VGVGVAITFITALVVGATSPRVSWFGRTITHGARDVPMVALTFDDGPNRASTLAVRDVLPETPTTPYSGRQIGRKTKLYRIINVREDPAGSHFSLDLSDLNR